MKSAASLKILQIGAGSMGTRRLRDLSRRDDIDVAVFDQRADRLEAAQTGLGVRGFAQWEEALAWEPAAFVISTPPGSKKPFVDYAYDHGIHHFAEADMWTYGAVERAARNPRVVGAPSASLGFLPMVEKLKAVRGELGSLLNYQLSLGTYMPSWHSKEGNEYYGRHRDTAPAREMVVFELLWLDRVFGSATHVAGDFRKCGDLPAPTEDTWSLMMRLENGASAQVTSTMACTQDYLRGSCLGSKGFMTWDMMSGEISAQIEGAKSRWSFGSVVETKDANYLAEMNGFVDAVRGRTPWPQTYEMSQQVCATLAAAERSAATGHWVEVDPRVEPDKSPPKIG